MARALNQTKNVRTNGMNPTESANLAVAMNDISTMKDDIKEIKENGATNQAKTEKLFKEQNQKIDDFIKSADKRYLQRIEGRVVSVLLGLLFSAIIAWGAFKDHWK